MIPAGFSQRFQTLPRIFSPCRASSPAPRRQGGSCRWLTSVLNVRGVSPSPSRFRLPSLTLVWGSARSRRFWRRFCAAGAALCRGCHRSCCFMLCTDRSARAVSSASLHEVAMCLQGLCPGQTGCQETGLRFLMTKGIHRALKILCYKMLVLIYQDSSRWMSCFHQESTSKRMHQQVHPVKGLAPLLFSPCSLHPRGLSPLPTHAQGTGIRVTVTV